MSLTGDGSDSTAGGGFGGSSSEPSLSSINSSQVAGANAGGNAGVAGNLANIVATGAGQLISANALGNVANAQNQQAQADRASALAYATPTAAYLAQQQQQLQLQESAISRQEALFNTIDPAKLEAGRQSLQLLRGQSAAALAPLQNQRATQRQQLLGQLRNQLGPGAETSSNGQNILNQFDQETASLVSTQQQASLNQLFSIANSTGPNEFAGAQALQSNLQQIQSQQKLMLAAQAATPLVQTAGSQFARSALQGQVLSNFGEGSGGTNVIGSLGSLVGKGGGSGGSGSSGWDAANSQYTGDYSQAAGGLNGLGASGFSEGVATNAGEGLGGSVAALGENVA